MQGDADTNTVPPMIDDAEARRIADEWRDHHGLDCLSLLADTGRIAEPVRRSRDEPPPPPTAGCSGLLRTMVREGYGADEQGERDLKALLAYVRHHGPRGPVDGWSER